MEANDETNDVGPKSSLRRSMWLSRMAKGAVGETKPRVVLVQALAFCGVIAAVWGLVAAVEVIYHVPQDVNQPEIGETPPVNQAPNDSSCVRELYRGQICRQALLSRQSCIDSNNASSAGNSLFGQVYIPAGSDQDALEQTASELLVGLESLPPDSQCQLTLLLPFLCSIMFGLCDSGGQLYTPSSGECTAVTEFVTQQGLLLPLLSVATAADVQLPQCEMLPDFFENCAAPVSGVTNATPVIPDCSSGFYVAGCPGLPVCRAECGEWEEFPRGARVTLDVFVVLSAIVYIVSTIVLVVLSAIRYKRMFKFPSIFIVYSPLPIGVFELLLLIGYMDRKNLFCSDIDLEESIQNPTAFCSLQGAVFYYAVLQQVCIWFFHVVVIFWGIAFPFSSRRLKKKGYQKVLHLSIVLISFVFPVIPLAVGFATGGYTIPRFPPTTCLAANLDATFYSFILPITVIMAAGISLVACMVCLLCGLSRSSAPYRWTTEKNLRDRVTKPTTKATAEVKLIIIFSYFFIFLALSQTAFTIALRNTASFQAGLTEYFFCEATGIPGHTCDRSFERVSGEIPIVLGFILLGLYPVVTLIYVVNVKELKEACCRRRKESLPTSSNRGGVYFSSNSKVRLKATLVTEDSTVNNIPEPNSIPEHTV